MPTKIENVIEWGSYSEYRVGWVLSIDIIISIQENMEWFQQLEQMETLNEVASNLPSETAHLL